MLTFYFNLMACLQNLIIFISFFLYSGDHGWPPVKIFPFFWNYYLSISDNLMELVKFLLVFGYESLFFSILYTLCKVISLFLQVFFLMEQIICSEFPVNEPVISFPASRVSWFNSVCHNWLITRWEVFSTNGIIVYLNPKHTVSIL